MDLVRVAVGVDIMVREVGDKIQLSRVIGLLEHQAPKLAFDLSKVYLGLSFCMQYLPLLCHSNQGSHENTNVLSVECIGMQHTRIRMHTK